MKNFRTFITESAAVEPFHSIKEVPAKKDLVDVHMDLHLATGGIYGKSKLGTTIPDRQMKHVQVNFGKNKYKGWGETFPNLEATGLPKRTIDTHQNHIDAVSKTFTAMGEPPMQVKQVHVLYNPHRTLVHLSNGKTDTAMTYHQGKTNGTGQRNFIAANGTKIPASQSQGVSMKTGEHDIDEINATAKALELSPRYETVRGVNSHHLANVLVRTGNAETHKIIWNKVKQTHERGWHAGTAVPSGIFERSEDKDLKKEIQTYFPGIRD